MGRDRNASPGGLVGSHEPSRKAISALTDYFGRPLLGLLLAPKMKLQGGIQISHGDIALVRLAEGRTAAEVLFLFAEANLGTMACVALWRPSSDLAQRSEFIDFEAPADPPCAMVSASALVCAVTYLRVGEQATVHVPVGFR